MSQTLVQTSAELAFTGTTSTITITPTAGNALFVYGAQVTSGAAIVAPTDTQSNSYTLKSTQTSGNGCGAVAEAVNVAGASTVITLGVASGSLAQSFIVQEWSGCATTAQPDASDGDSTAAATTHDESATGVNPTGACVVFSSSSTNVGSPTGKTPGSGYTSVTSSRASVWWQYQIFTVAPTSEKSLWTSSSTAQSGSLMAIKAAAGGATFSDVIGGGVGKTLISA